MQLSLIFSVCGTATPQSKTTPVLKEKKSKKKKVEEGGNSSQKSYPAFVMPSRSEMKKIKSAEFDKKKKRKDGFYQEKSDQDDTLEKVESLHLEMSDKTRRAAKKKMQKKKV